MLLTMQANALDMLRQCYSLNIDQEETLRNAFTLAIKERFREINHSHSRDPFV